MATLSRTRITLADARACLWLGQRASASAQLGRHADRAGFGVRIDAFGPDSRPRPPDFQPPIGAAKPTGARRRPSCVGQRRRRTPAVRPPGRQRDAAAHERRRAAHFCVVVEELRATYTAIKAAGAVFHSEPTQLVGTTTMVYVRDPDGSWSSSSSHTRPSVSEARSALRHCTAPTTEASPESRMSQPSTSHPVSTFLRLGHRRKASIGPVASPGAEARQRRVDDGHGCAGRVPGRTAVARRA
jgi:catechol 2,3-dioxygenase-like lactoylglutathione lyase family enzyme